MIKNFVSSKRVIARVIRDFKPTDKSWLNDVYVWIADVLDFVGCYSLFEDTYKKVKVVNGKAKVPETSEGINYIEHENCELPRSDNHNIINKCKCSKPCHKTKSYILNGNYIITSFDEGEIIVYYKTILVDEQGFPQVPSNVEFLDACAWYIISKLLMQGVAHPTIDLKTALMMWNDGKYKARNDINIPDEQDEEMFRNNWVNFKIQNTQIDYLYGVR